MDFFGSFTAFVWTLVAGLIAGWAVGELRKGEGFGLFGNLCIGMIGAFVGSVFFHGLHLDRVMYRVFPVELPIMLQPIVYAFVGAMVLLFFLDRLGLKT